MMDNNHEIKEFMKVYKLSNSDCAEILNMKYQSYTNKLHKGEFKVHELKLLADKVGCRVAIIDADNRPVFIFKCK